jgi:hypothetical protein
MKLVKMRRANILVIGSASLLTGYIFFLLPWIFVGPEANIIEIRTLSHYIITIGLAILAYGAIKMYLDLKEVIK